MYEDLYGRYENLCRVDILGVTDTSRDDIPIL